MGNINLPKCARRGRNTRNLPKCARRGRNDRLYVELWRWVIYTGGQSSFGTFFSLVVFVWDHFAWHSTNPWWLLSLFKSVGHDRKAWLVPLEPRADSRLVLFYKIVHGYVAVSLRLYIIALNCILRTSHELAYRQIDARRTSCTRCTHFNHSQ